MSKRKIKVGDIVHLTKYGIGQMTRVKASLFGKVKGIRYDGMLWVVRKGSKSAEPWHPDFWEVYGG